MSKLAELLKKKPAPIEEVKSVVPKITISFEKQYVEINGITFELLKSDADILSDALRLIDESEKLDLNDEKAVLKNLRDMASYIDTILGVGALQKISGGVPVGFRKLQECMAVIVGAVYAAYQTATASKYGV